MFLEFELTPCAEETTRKLLIEVYMNLDIEDNLYIYHCRDYYPSISAHGKTPKKAFQELLKVLTFVISDTNNNCDVRLLGIKDHDGG